jgi:hypothetical protein
MAIHAPPVYVIPNNDDDYESLLFNRKSFLFSVILLSLENKLIGSTSLIESLVIVISLCEDQLLFV